jgi:uncharacterized protein YdeI (YjbR/CyaY-like superfamily)
MLGPCKRLSLAGGVVSDEKAVEVNPDTFRRLEILSARDLWSWLEEHHSTDESVWLVTWKAVRPDRYVSRDDVLDALVAYGWIDGRRMKLDDERTMQLISPRRQQAWAQTYRDRAARLERDGLMKPRGREVLESAKRSGVFDAMQHADLLEDPQDLVMALKPAGALPWWSLAAPSYRRNILRFIAGAKGAQTRAKRIATVVEHAAQGKKVPHY